MRELGLNTLNVLRSIAQYRFKSIYLRNTALILLASLLPLTILGSILFDIVTQNLEQEFFALYFGQIGRTGRAIDQEISKIDVSANMILAGAFIRPLQCEKELDPFVYETLKNLQDLADAFRFAASSNELILFVDLAFGSSQTVARSEYGMCPVEDYPYKDKVTEIMELPVRSKTPALTLLTSPQGTVLVRSFPIFSFATKQTDVLLIGLDPQKVCGLMDIEYKSSSSYLVNQTTGQTFSDRGQLLESHSQERTAVLATLENVQPIHIPNDFQPQELWGCVPSAFSGWHYVTRVDVSDYYRQISQYQKRFIWLTAGVLLAVTVISFGVMQKTSEPIGMLLSILHNPTDWLGQSSLSQKSIAETSQIAKSFLSYYKKNQELEASLRTYTQKLQEAQIMALRSQISPHFLYNTLDSIYWSVYEELPGPSQLPEVITSLSDMLRYGLEDSGNLVDIAQECVHAKSYLNIMQYRYDFHFHVIWELDPDLMGDKIIKVTLQPLLENALAHGLNQRDSHAQLHISIKRQDDFILVTVWDNGRGFAPEKLDALNRQLTLPEEALNVPVDHIGLGNVNLRYKLLIGSTAEFTLRNHPLGGAEVQLRYQRI